eukprot:TRINITY_DN24804_c0_g1_i1.p1 TRINITY_DN24804_c0_g1~~TRINITY_DN24804_c0_g1_i1.p1  ORF type:complete len:330 (+),score=61.60 TRINITY_DN24804_c0_g1_i1:48-992(+)
MAATVSMAASASEPNTLLRSSRRAIANHRDPKRAGLEDCIRSTQVGDVKSFDSSLGYGFISCDETFRVYRRDIFLHRDQLGPFGPGDRVSFLVKIGGSGHPQAYGLRDASQTVEKACASAATADQGELEVASTKKGKVKSFNLSKGYGFIDALGSDVFFPTSLLPDVNIGEDVEFEVQLKGGKLQAHSLKRIPKQHFDAQANKKLLRACASTRKDSYQEMFALLNAGANPNGRDVTGQTTLMVAALSTTDSEKKCRLLVGMGADVHAIYREELTVLQWARERVSCKLAAHLDALSRGEQIDCDLVLDMMASAEV